MPSPTAAPAGGSAAATGVPVASASARAPARVMRSPSAAGPTMSPSTAPASIEASWPGSPTRISRASGRTASTSRAISDSDTIEVSSTITTSCGSRLPRSWRKRLWLPGRQPSSRCSVDAVEREQPRADLVVDVELARPRRGRPPRAARRPCRSARRARRAAAARPRRAACSASSATIRATVVVLPVPGPPATTAKPAQHARPRRRSALAAVGLRRRTGARARRRARRRRRRRGGAAASARRSAATCALLAPVAVEVERAADEPQRAGSRLVLADGDERARGDARDPGRRARATAAPRRSTGSSASTVAVSRIVARST